MSFSWNPSAVIFEINNRNKTDVFFISILQDSNPKSESKVQEIDSFFAKLNPF